MMSYKTRKKLVLKYELEKPLSEQTVRGLSLSGRDSGDSFFRLSSALRMAAADKRVSGLLFVVRSFNGGWAQAEELGVLIEKFRASGKKAFVYLEKADNLSYYLASGFDRVFMPPAATLELIGLRIEKFYLKNLLEYAGINPDLISIGKYKSAGEVLVREGMSEPDREAMSAILEELSLLFQKRLARGRGIREEALPELIDRGPWTAGLAEENGLIDDICYEDELEKKIFELSPGKLVDASRRQKRGLLHKLLALRKPKIALIAAAGKITDGPSRHTLLGNQLSGARTLKKQLSDARKKKRIKAVVLRIDSPGGSATASDLIWREISLTARQKPVVCSMGNTAASGGYYLASAADHIMASEATLTGSIGVIGGKFDLSGLLEKMKIKTEALQINSQAGYSSVTAPLSPREKARLRELLSDFYENLFLRKVALKTGKSPDQLRPLAEGRVWTGSQALASGLVDSTGGLDASISEACSRAGIPRSKCSLVVLSSRSRLRDLVSLRGTVSGSRVLAILPSFIRIS